MKKALLTGAAALTLFDIVGAQPANADPAASWEGAYAGVHIGYREGDGDFNTGPFNITIDGNPAPVPARSGSTDPGGVFGGAQGGFNRAIGQSVLIGLEGDFSLGSHKDTATTTGNVVNGDGTAFVVRNASLELGWQATLRGRLGVTNGPWLLFGTAGIAAVDSEWRDSYSSTLVSGSGPINPASGSSRDSDTLFGWVAGGGVAREWGQNRSVQVDFLYEDFGDRSVPSAVGPATSLDVTAYRVRFGLNFKLGPGPGNQP